MASKIENTECLCVFVASLGDFLEPLKGLLTTVEATLVTIKTLLALIPTNLADLLEKELLEVQLTLIEAVLAPVEAPITSLNRYTRAFADCPPVAHLSDLVDVIKKYSGVAFLEELKYEIDQKIDGIERESLKVEQIDDLIRSIQDFKEALDACGTNA